jgi:hypothetical protein
VSPSQETIRGQATYLFNPIDPWDILIFSPTSVFMRLSEKAQASETQG